MPYVDKPSTTDLLDVLSKRSELLELVGDGVTDKRELEARLDCSRSTLNRGIRELEAAGLLLTSHPDPELTLAGEVAVEAFADVWEPLVTALPLLDHLSDDAPFTADVFEGATVVESTMPNPDAPVDALADLLGDVDRVRATVPTRSSPFVRVFAERIRSLETAEFLLTEDCLEYVRANGCPELATILDSGACSLETIPERPPYSLVIGDDSSVWLGIYDAKGKIVGAIVNDEREALEWALETFREFQSGRP